MSASYSYSVILEPQEGGGFTVLVPALPEVVTEGDTEQEEPLPTPRRRSGPSSRIGWNREWRRHPMLIPRSDM